MSIPLSITHSELVEAVHLISHQQARLWAPTPQCGCVDRADTMWDFLEKATTPVPDLYDGDFVAKYAPRPEDFDDDNGRDPMEDDDE